MSRSFVLSTSPSCSGIDGSRRSAESGLMRRPFSPLPFSTTPSACLFWLIGRCPMTSPVETKSKPRSAIISPARRIIVVWQSMQGFIAPPKPCGGFSTSAISSSVKSTTVSGTPSAAAALRAVADEKKGVSKHTASISAPARWRTRTASWLSSPPLSSERPLAPLI